MSKRTRMHQLTDDEWRRVFRVRCASKSGSRELTDEEKSLVQTAFDSDPERYSKMEIDVFNATVPFGSNVKRTR